MTTTLTGKVIVFNLRHLLSTEIASRWLSNFIVLFCCIYQYSNMAPRLSGQTSIFGVVSFVSISLMEIEGQKRLEKFAILTRKPWSHA